MEEYLDFFFNSEVKKHAFDHACQVLADNDSRMEKYRIAKLTRVKGRLVEKKETCKKEIQLQLSYIK